MVSLRLANLPLSLFSPISLLSSFNFGTSTSFEGVVVEVGVIADGIVGVVGVGFSVLDAASKELAALEEMTPLDLTE